MYRQNLQRRMEEEQFFLRVGNLPVICSAITQASDIYFRTKESNRLVRYTLNTAESGVKCMASKAQPVVTKFNRPIDKLNGYACTQLRYLEERYPLITKPTQEVTDTVYGKTLKPAVDQVNAVTKYGVDTANSVKSFGLDKANNIKDYGLSKVNDVKTYGNEKATQLLNTSCGQAVSTTTLSTLSSLLDVAERYVDYYLPEIDVEEKENVEMVVEKQVESDTISRAMRMGGKVRKRMHRHAMRKLADVQKRSKETIASLHSTVDLIQFAKDNLNSTRESVVSGVDRCHQIVGSSVVQCQDKVWSVWEEINKSEDEVMEDDKNIEKKEQSLESRMIATARHLTLKLKRGFNSLPNINLFPAGIGERVSSIKQYTEDLYSTFRRAETYEDLPSRLLAETKDKLGYLQETLTFVTEMALDTRVFSWLVLDFELKNEDFFFSDDLEEDGEFSLFGYVPYRYQPLSINTHME